MHHHFKHRAARPRALYTGKAFRPTPANTKEEPMSILFFMLMCCACEATRDALSSVNRRHAERQRRPNARRARAYHFD